MSSIFHDEKGGCAVCVQPPFMFMGSQYLGTTNFADNVLQEHFSIKKTMDPLFQHATNILT